MSMSMQSASHSPVVYLWIGVFMVTQIGIIFLSKEDLRINGEVFLIRALSLGEILKVFLLSACRYSVAIFE